MRIKVLIFTILALFSLSFITGCQPSDKGGKKGGKGNKITGEFAFPKLDQLKEGKFTVLGCDVTIPDKDRELLKNEYNLEPDIINVAWDEVFKRAATLVMTGESPDMVILGRGGIPYVTNNIAQKIDPYIDFSHPFYEKLKDAYEETEWGENEHYFLIRDLVKLSGMVYNAKMFEDAGLENPWEQYKNGTWDWNAFRETAKELSADSDGDGQIDVYGFGFYRPQIFAHTTGKPFGILDTKTMKITSNLRDPDIARAMNLIYDVIYKDKSGLNDSTSILDTFSRENMAMVLYDINPIRLPEVQKLADKGQVGLAPLPRDPNVDKHYSYSYITHDIIPVGAKNPQAAVAYNAVIRYNSLSPQIREEALQKSKTEWNYTDLLIEQIDELHREGYGDIVPVYDQLEIIGYNATWDCIYNSLPWATAIEARSAESEAYIAEILEVKEVDLPSGPKVIEQFEKYAINTDEPIPFNKLYSVSGGNPNWEAYLDKENKYQGNFATKVYYTFDEKDGADWGGFTKNLNITWNTNNTFTFWAKGDGKPQEVTIQFEAGDVPWTYTMTVDGTKGKVYEIPFSEFKVPDWWEDQAAQLDLTLIKTVSFIFKGEGGRHICLDDIRVIRK